MSRVIEAQKYKMKEKLQKKIPIPSKEYFRKTVYCQKSARFKLDKKLVSYSVVRRKKNSLNLEVLIIKVVYALSFGERGFKIFISACVRNFITEFQKLSIKKLNIRVS